LKVPIKSQEDCFIKNPEFTLVASKRTFCGGSRDGSTGPCIGDSGSGMFIQFQNTFFLRGIVSSSLIDQDTTCDVTNYALYTDVFKFLPWVKNPFIVQREKAPVSNEICGDMGVGSGLIQGGYQASREIFPWTVAMHDNYVSSYEWNVLKTGTLVSRKHVVFPAGFVVYADDNGEIKLISTSRLTLYFGAHILKYKDSLPTQSSGVAKLIKHPSYKNGSPREANIAVAVASKEIEFSDSIKPACIPSYRASSDDLIGSYGFGVGWGMDESLKLSESKKYLKMKVISHAQCEKEHTQKSVIFSKYFCASSGSNETTCFGDDPIYFKTGSKWYLRGLWTAFYKLGNNWQCDPAYSILYEDVALYSVWIKEQMKNN
jgi:Trypsin